MDNSILRGFDISKMQLILHIPVIFPFYFILINALIYISPVHSCVKYRDSTISSFSLSNYIGYYVGEKYTAAHQRDSTKTITNIHDDQDPNTGQRDLKAEAQSIQKFSKKKQYCENRM